MVHVGQVERAVAEVGRQARDGGELQIAIVAVGLEAGGKIARERELLGELLACDPERGALLVDAVAAERGAQAEFGIRRRRGDDVDHAAHGVRAVERGARSAHHLDALDAFERHRDIHVVVAGLHVVEPHAVEQHQRLAEARAADREVGLHAVRRAFGEVERRVQLQQVRQRIEHQALAAHRKHADGAVDFLQRHRLEGAGHDHGFALLRAAAARRRVRG